MKIYHYFFICLIICSCNDEIDIQPVINPDPYCITSIPVDGVLPIDYGCDNYQDPSDPESLYWCDFIHVDTLMLSEVSKCWIAQYKYEVGKTFQYINDRNQTLELTLTEKDHLLAHTVLGSEECDSSEYNLGHCYHIESYYIILENKDKKIKIYIAMGSDLFNIEDPVYHGLQDERMNILKLKPEGGFSGYTFRAEEFNRSPFILAKFEEEKIILNKKFENVYTPGDWGYSKELGLISFEDDENILWRIDL